MQKKISPKITALTFGVLVITFLMVFYVVAWQEPTSTPPSGNVASPLNIGPEGQSKEGGLILNTGGAEIGLIIDQGEVCIGDDCLSSWPETGVVVTYHMDVVGYQDGSDYYGKTVSYSCPEESTVVNISLSQSMVWIENSGGGDSCEEGCNEFSCSPTQANSCSYSINGNTVYLTAKILQLYHEDCACCTVTNLTSYCYPHSVPPWNLHYYTCSIPPACSLEFQCGIKTTVGI